MKKLTFILFLLFCFPCVVYGQTISTGGPGGGLTNPVTDAQVVDTLTITNISQVQDITASAAEINTIDNCETTELFVGGGAGSAPVCTTANGTGAPVRTTNAALVTPDLGTPSAVVLTNATGTIGSVTFGGFTVTRTLYSNALGNATAGDGGGDIEVSGDDLMIKKTVTLGDTTGRIATTLNATADGMSDDQYNGTTIVGRNCGEGLTQWDTVYLKAADADIWHQADATAASGEYPAIGLAVAACTDTNAATILVTGIVRNEGWTGLTVASPVYLGESDGALTQTAPSTANDAVQIIGWALSDSEIYFDFSRPYQLVE